jgi:hypothetical protein
MSALQLPRCQLQRKSGLERLQARKLNIRR